jgi:glycosyltransferase involved in cell wall biosynthesis
VPKVLVISDHRRFRSPSQRYRYEQYISFLEKNGFEFTFSPIITESDDKVFYSKGKVLLKALITFKSLLIRCKDWLRYNKFDIVFIQREALYIGSTFFEHKAFQSKAKVIFDFDDSIWLMDTSPENKKYEFLKNPDKAKTNLKHAHLVIAGNNYLADFAKQFNANTIIIPTTVDCDLHKPKPELRNKEQVVIGWSGSISTVKHFEAFVPVLKKLKDKYGNKIAFKLLGEPNYKNTELNIVGDKWTADTEVDELNKMDIGLMPLPDDKWANGKCGLKGLTYMACGVATVMSPVGVNKEIISNGVNGFLADSETEWLNCLSQLIENKDLRIKLGEAGRTTVVSKYSVAANKENYLKAFQSVLNA